MDLQDFEGQDMYFDSALPPKVEALIEQAAEGYGAGEAETPLLQAFMLASDNLMVHVALYRFYYYQHRYQDALFIADKAMESAGKVLDLPRDWRDLKMDHMGMAAMQSMGMLRFYLLAMKGAGYLNLRLGNIQASIEILNKLVALDMKNRLGADMLLDIAKGKIIEDIAEQSENVVRLHQY